MMDDGWWDSVWIMRGVWASVQSVVWLGRFGWEGNLMGKSVFDLHSFLDTFFDWGWKRWKTRWSEGGLDQLEDGPLLLEGGRACEGWIYIYIYYIYTPLCELESPKVLMKTKKGTWKNSASEILVILAQEGWEETTGWEAEGGWEWWISG